MWTKALLFILPTLVRILSAKLSGDHICQEEVRFVINEIEYFPRNTTIRQYKWCMNVPPRCSFYNTKLINDSRLVAKEVIHHEDKCCPGFKQTGDMCLPECGTECIKGTCHEGICHCQAGFKGTNCNMECASLEWGINCENSCDCTSMMCMSITGICICPVGYAGSTCAKCPDGSYGVHCKSKCNCSENTTCHHVSGECPVQTTIQSTTTTDKLETIQIKHDNNGQFQTDPTGLLFNNDTQINEEKENSSETHVTTVHPENMMKSVKSKVQNEVTVSPSLDEDFLNDDGITHQNTITKDEPTKSTTNNGYVTAIFVVVIAMTIALIVVQRVWKRKEKNVNNNDAIKNTNESDNATTIAPIYAHPRSIFHTPLPDVPTIESIPPFMDRSQSVPNEKIPNGKAGFKPRDSIPSTDHCVTKPSPENLFYDHPPLTGSYRPASKIEPSDNIDFTYVTEPLYDEIPLGMMPTPVNQYSPESSLYVNTFCKTRF